MSFFEYTTPCPECQKESVDSHLRFSMESGKVVCSAETPHEFDEMPGEPAPSPESETAPLTSDLAQEARVSEPAWTPEEEAALDEAMKQDPRPRDFSAMVTDPAPEVTAAEIVAPEPSGTQGEAILGDVLKITAGQYRVGDILVRDGDRLVPESPRVGLGEVVPLPNGDALCGIRISETWVSALQSEGENQHMTLVEYLQKIMDEGLLDWHALVPARESSQRDRYGNTL